MENFSGQLKKYNVTINDLLAENEKLKARASESGKMKDRMERAKLERASGNGSEKGAYHKNGGITHDTAVFALALKIRSRPQLEPSSDYHYLVRITGVEPAPPCED